MVKMLVERERERDENGCFGDGYENQEQRKMMADGDSDERGEKTERWVCLVGEDE